MKKLEDFEVGDVVQMWCIGWCGWDDCLSKIVSKDSYEVKVETPRGSGCYSRMSPSTGAR